MGALLSGGQSSRSRASGSARNKEGSEMGESEDKDRPGFASSKTYVYSGEKAEKAESTSVS